MAQSEDQTSFEGNYKLLHKLCHSYVKKAKMAGLVLDYDDLYQEACLTWVKAQKSFDPSKNFRFTTYMGVAVAHRLAGSLHKAFEDRRVLVKQVRNSEDDPSQESWLESVSLDVGAELSPEDKIEQEEFRQVFYDRLSPEARMVLSIIEDTPKEIQDELVAMQEKSKYGRSLGVNSKAPTDVSFSFVARHVMPVYKHMSVLKISEIRAEIFGGSNE
jgi:RNA polymerase sigma factor (sigma-70 family)